MEFASRYGGIPHYIHRQNLVGNPSTQSIPLIPNGTCVGIKGLFTTCSICTEIDPLTSYRRRYCYVEFSDCLDAYDKLLDGSSFPKGWVAHTDALGFETTTFKPGRCDEWNQAPCPTPEKFITEWELGNLVADYDLLGVVPPMLQQTGCGLNVQ